MPKKSTSPSASKKAHSKPANSGKKATAVKKPVSVKKSAPLKKKAVAPKPKKVVKTAPKKTVRPSAQKAVPKKNSSTIKPPVSKKTGVKLSSKKPVAKLSLKKSAAPKAAVKKHLKKATKPAQKVAPLPAPTAKKASPRPVLKAFQLRQLPTPLQIPPPGVEKLAQSHSSNHVIYRVKTFVGWFSAIVGVFAVLSLLASWSAPEVGSPNAVTQMVQVSTFNDLSLTPPTTPEAAPSPTAPQLDSAAASAAQEEPIVMMATGDILLARYVEKRMRALNDYTYPFHNVAEVLRSGDLTFGNIETPVLKGYTTPNGSTTFRADAESITGLTFAGYDVVSVANNHTMNYRAPGLLQLIDALDANSIKHAGGGTNIAEAHKPAVLDVKGRRIAILAYSDPSIPPGGNGEAAANSAGIASMDIDQVKKDVAEAKAQYSIVIVSMHAGIEYRTQPNQFQKDFAHAAVDAGASLVIGHHPHVVQPAERYKDGLILYSLGNFVFDQFFSDAVRDGVIAKITFAPQTGRPSVEFMPTRLDSVQPYIINGLDRLKYLQALGLPESL